MRKSLLFNISSIGLPPIIFPFFAVEKWIKKQHFIFRSLYFLLLRSDNFCETQLTLLFQNSNLLSCIHYKCYSRVLYGAWWITLYVAWTFIKKNDPLAKILASFRLINCSFECDLLPRTQRVSRCGTPCLLCAVSNHFLHPKGYFLPVFWTKENIGVCLCQTPKFLFFCVVQNADE